MNVEKLSDYQLLILLKNDNLDKEFKSSIILEKNKRKLNQEIICVNFKFSNYLKLKIIITSLFLFIYHIKFSSTFLIYQDRKSYKKYWKYFNIGIVVWIFFLLLIARYIIQPYFYKVT